MCKTFRREILDTRLSESQFFGKVLDVGGKKDNKRGDFTPPLNQVDSWEYLNIDSSSNPDYLCSADAMPIDDNTFDVVILSEVLEHVSNPEKVIVECFRVLKQGGRLFISMPFLFPIHADPYDFQRWTEYKLIRSLKEIGFKHIQCQSMGGAFSVIFDIIFSTANSSSKNLTSIKSKIIRRVMLPLVKPIFRFLDRRYIYKSKFITTGYYVECEK